MMKSLFYINFYWYYLQKCMSFIVTLTPLKGSLCCFFADFSEHEWFGRGKNVRYYFCHWWTLTFLRVGSGTQCPSDKIDRVITKESGRLLRRAKWFVLFVTLKTWTSKKVLSTPKDNRRILLLFMITIIFHC